MKRRIDSRQTGWFDTPRIDQLPVSVANDAEEPAPKVRIIEQNEEYVNVSHDPSNSSRCFCVSIRRAMDAAEFSLSFTEEQLKQIVIQGSKLLGVIAFDLDELDDSFPEIEEDSDEE